MKTNISFFISIFLIFLISAISFGQGDLSQNKLTSLKETDIKLNISLKEKEIKKSDPIQLEISIQNNFSRNISTLPFYIDDLLAFCVIGIHNSQGELLNRIDEVKPRLGSRTALNMIPNERTNFFLQLNKAYYLSVGKYSITTSFVAIDRDKKEKVVIKSNTETFTVVE